MRKWVDLTNFVGCRKTADICSLHSRKTIWPRLALYVRNMRNEFAPFARIFAFIDSRYIHSAERGANRAARIRGSSRVERLSRSLFFFLCSLASAMLSIPLPFPGSVCTASINIYNETRSSDCTPLPIWPESLASAPVILGRLPVIFTKRGH